MGRWRTAKNRRCTCVENAHRTEAPRTRHRCRSSCATRIVNTLRVCALRAMSAQLGVDTMAFDYLVPPANCSVLNDLVDADRA